MQWQLMSSRSVAANQPAAAFALCAVVLCATEGRAQLALGPVRVDVTGDARKVLTAVLAADRVASKVPARSAARVLPTAERYRSPRPARSIWQVPSLPMVARARLARRDETRAQLP